MLMILFMSFSPFQYAFMPFHISRGIAAAGFHIKIPFSPIIPPPFIKTALLIGFIYQKDRLYSFVLACAKPPASHRGLIGERPVFYAPC